MKILYDHQAFTFQQFGGVSRCFCELIAQMPEGVQTEIAVKQTDNVHLLASHLCDGRLDDRITVNMRRWKRMLPFRGSALIQSILVGTGLLRTMESANDRYARERIAVGDFDVFHPTFFNPYFLPLIGEKPWVFTVHDMMPELFPQYYRPDDEQIVFKRRYLPRAAHIIAVSENTRQDLIRLLGVAEDRITVIHHGGPARETVTSPRLVPSPYFLYVGDRSKYKNFLQTLRDFTDFHRFCPEVKLLCTGSDFTLQERQTMKALGISGAVQHISASDQQMKNLYANALAFVYPSLYEGFGMPILEAYAYGCPVLLNHKSCFPEIAADAAIYFDSVEGNSNLAERLATVRALSADEREGIICRGYDRLAHFSWRASAERLSRVYEDVMLRQSAGPRTNR